MSKGFFDRAMSLVKYLAVGRLVKDDGEFKEGKHQIVCGLMNDSNDPSGKSFKNHVKQIMDKGANKLKPGKRIRLTSDEEDYELHVLSDCLDGDEDEVLVYFAVTDPAFGKAHSIPKLLDELKDGFLDTNDASDIRKAKAGGSVNKASQQLLRSLMTKYGSSKLTEVQVKVNEVKEVMQDNMKKALNNVETLEEMENKAENFQDQAKQFDKKSSKVKHMQKMKYYKVTGAIALFVILIITIIVASYA